MTATLERVPAARPGAETTLVASRLLRLFALDAGRSAGRRVLVCHWHRDDAGRLVAAWEPDIGTAPLR